MKVKLSDNMKRVLCGISHFPDDNNKMLAKRLAVNTSTISTARQRLNDRDLTKKSYVPSFFNIDLGKVVVCAGKYRYQFPSEIRENIMGLVTHPALPFLTISDNISWLVMGLIPPETNDSDGITHSGLEEKYLYDMTFDVNKITFQTPNTKVKRYFDYSPLLCKTLDVNLSIKNNIHKEPWNLDELKKNEKIILKSLINDSGPSDYQRSHKVGISHPTITRIRKSLIERGIIKTVVKPNLDNFGFGMFSWFNIKFDGKSLEKDILNSLCSYPNNILSIYNENDIFILSVFYDMKDLMMGQQRVEEFLSSEMISYENIAFNYFSLENPTFVLNSRMDPATQIFSELPKRGEIEAISTNLIDELNFLLKGFITEEEAISIVDAVRERTDSKEQKEESTESSISMILELLTEPRYLSSIEKTKRMALQTKLIERLNILRGMARTEKNLASDIRKKRVLIVEDSRAMTELLKEIFNEANLNVVGAVEDGQSAYNMYRRLSERKKRPDIVLMDVFIKGINGIEATRMIKEYDPSASIIILTSSLDNKVKNQINAIGVDDYLIKPVTKSQLISRIERTLSERKAVIK
jgi:two-component system chemotaxis response regulator CheY